MSSKLFYERFAIGEEGVRRVYTRVKILIWDGEPDRFLKPRVILSWLVLDDGSFGQPKIEIEESGPSAATHACKLALRLMTHLKRCGWDFSPSDAQGVLQRLRAAKCVRDEQFNTHAVALDGLYLPV